MDWIGIFKSGLCKITLIIIQIRTNLKLIFKNRKMDCLI